MSGPEHSQSWRGERGAWGFVVLAGCVYAGLLGALAAMGHQPSMTRGLPVAPELYYGAAACYVVPLLSLGAWIFSRVLARVAGVRPTPPMLVAYAAPILVTFLVPDIVGLAVSGYDSLSVLVRITAPLTAIGIVALGARAVRAAEGRRAWIAALAGLLAQAVVVAPFLR